MFSISILMVTFLNFVNGYPCFGVRNKAYYLYILSRYIFFYKKLLAEFGNKIIIYILYNTVYGFLFLFYVWSYVF